MEDGMAKFGILHDYDLMANEEKSAQAQTCVVCGMSPVSYLWSDFSGEAMCRKCGTPYQLKWGTDKQKEEGKYPYLNLSDQWVPVVREYHETTGKWTCFGTMMGGRPGMPEFIEWVKEHHPELLKG